MSVRADHLSIADPNPVQVAADRSLEARTDDDLMLLARAGVRPAFHTLVQRHQRRALAVAARLVGSWSLAPDVAQESFLQLYRALPNYQPCGKFGAYLNRILINECRMARRGRRSDDRGQREVRRAPIEPVLGADTQIIARERQREVQKALDDLSPNLREVAVLRHSGGLSYDEISRALSLPVGTVKRRLFEAMGKLRRRMVEE